MDTHHTWQFWVRSYEVGADGEVRPIAYLNYLEEMAVQGSDVLGYDRAWYENNHRLWVIRKLVLRHFNPARAGDELALTTWISETRRVQAYREYDLRRANGERILCARHTWVYLNADTLALERLPSDFSKITPPEGGLESIDLAVPGMMPITEAETFTAERRVVWSELDENAHVNNAVYVQWADEMLRDARRAFDSDSAGWRRAGREVEYFQSVVEGEPIRLTTRMIEKGASHSAWLTEIRHGISNDLVAQDRAIYVTA